MANIIEVTRLVGATTRQQKDKTEDHVSDDIHFHAIEKFSVFARDMVFDYIKGFLDNTYFSPS